MSEDERGRTLTVATLNVHGWVDARQEDNIERVAALVKVRICFNWDRLIGTISKFWGLVVSPFVCTEIG